MANLSSGVDIVHATRQVCCPAEKTAGKKLHDWKKCWLHLCKLETCTYISLAAMYGLTAIEKILVAGWKHASFLCYSMGARWFLRFLGPKLELPRSSAYSPYLRRLWFYHSISILYHTIAGLTTRDTDECMLAMLPPLITAMECPITPCICCLNSRLKQEIVEHQAI